MSIPHQTSQFSISWVIARLAQWSTVRGTEICDMMGSEEDPVDVNTIIAALREGGPFAREAAQYYGDLLRQGSAGGRDGAPVPEECLIDTLARNSELVPSALNLLIESVTNPSEPAHLIKEIQNIGVVLPDKIVEGPIGKSPERWVTWVNEIARRTFLPFDLYLDIGFENDSEPTILFRNLEPNSWQQLPYLGSCVWRAKLADRVPADGEGYLGLSSGPYVFTAPTAREHFEKTAAELLADRNRRKVPAFGAAQALHHYLGANGIPNGEAVVATLLNEANDLLLVQAAQSAQYTRLLRHPTLIVASPWSITEEVVRPLAPIKESMEVGMFQDAKNLAAEFLNAIEASLGGLFAQMEQLRATNSSVMSGAAFLVYLATLQEDLTLAVLNWETRFNWPRSAAHIIARGTLINQQLAAEAARLGIPSLNDPIPVIQKHGEKFGDLMLDLVRQVYERNFYSDGIRMERLMEFTAHRSPKI